MRRTIALTAILATAGLLGCGGGHHAATRSGVPVATAHNVAKPPCNPPRGQGHLGVCVPHQTGLSPHQLSLVALPPNGGLIPDVYEGDAVYSWNTAMQHSAGAIVKAWEYRQDRAFASNWQTLKRIGKWHAAYLFVRSYGCTSQAASYLAAVNAQGGFDQPNTGPPILDAETPDARPCVASEVAYVERQTHRQAIIYTAPGTWPGGSHGDALLWAAGYGNYSHSPCVWTCSPVAWQYTDGTYGPYPHQIPGIQPGDVSVNYGITRLVVTPPKPRLRCFGPHAQRSDPTCVRVRALTNRRSRARDATLGAMGWNRCSTRPVPRARSYANVLRYLATVPVREPCRPPLRGRARWFADRVHDALVRY